MALISLAAAACSRSLQPDGDDSAASLPNVVAAIGNDGLSRERLLDPTTCQSCHPEHYDSWAQSMHAHAGDDPVFVAMNARGQADTKGSLGDFCVRCHAPMALREGKTTDGLNLAQLPQSLRGVTCYFCHNVEQVAGTHNNPLVLANDTVMRGSIADPVPNAAHASAPSKLMDRTDAQSAALCGSCHDIKSRLDAHIERTYLEWQQSAYNSPTGNTCNSCHMGNLGTPRPAADLPGLPDRQLHSHLFPAVDVADDPTLKSPLAAANQAFLDNSLSAALCVVPLTKTTYQLRVALDNVASGHGFTSGAALDRRLWAEVMVQEGGKTIYQSGVADDVAKLIKAPDEDLWLLRECIFDAQGAPLHMFWDAASATSNTLSAPATFDVNDPRVTLGHRERTYPLDRGKVLSGAPEQITLRMRLQPIGQDVLEDLVQSGHLDKSHLEQLPIYDLGSTKLTWTRQALTQGGASYIDENGQQAYCVKTPNFNPAAPRQRDTSTAQCRP